MPEPAPIRILVVDDDEDFRDLCVRRLSAAGYAISSAGSLDEATKRLAEGFDIILTDLYLSDSPDGNEVTRRARAAGNADVLIMTGTPGLDSAIEAIRNGAYDYIVKPFKGADLRLAIDRCVEKRRLSRELAREKELRGELDTAYQNLARMEKVRAIFGQFATPEVAEVILSHPEDFWKRGEKRIVTVLFADVRNFTPFAAGSSPEQAVSVLNEIFGRMMEAIRSQGGVVNKFIGDGLMALFGAPVTLEDHARRAAEAALEAVREVEILAESRSQRGLAPLKIGVGINTGEVVAGCVGTEQRADYSVIGHAVNVASRLEGAAGPSQILVGPETARLIAPYFELRDKGLVGLSGVAEPIRISELVGPRPDRSAPGA